MAEYIKVDDVIDLARRGYLVGNRNFKSAEAFIRGIPTADVVLGSDFRDCRNELCLCCGKYKERHPKEKACEAQ